MSSLPAVQRRSNSQTALTADLEQQNSLRIAHADWWSSRQLIKTLSWFWNWHLQILWRFLNNYHLSMSPKVYTFFYNSNLWCVSFCNFNLPTLISYSSPHPWGSSQSCVRSIHLTEVVPSQLTFMFLSCMIREELAIPLVQWEARILKMWHGRTLSSALSCQVSNCSWG